MPRTADSNRTVMDYRNYHYNSIIAKINSKPKYPVDEAIKLIRVYSTLVKRLLSHFSKSVCYVNLRIEYSRYTHKWFNLNNQKSTIVSNFWDMFSEGVAKNEAKSDEICAGPNCSKSISAFDFRCYQCRERFCESCKGSGLTCPSCS